LPEAREACLAAGMDDVLVKPLGIAQISTLLAHWFAGRVAPLMEAGCARLSVEPFPATATLHGLAESLNADMHALHAAVTAQHWDEVAGLAHRIRGVVACTRADAGIDQA